MTYQRKTIPIVLVLVDFFLLYIDKTWYIGNQKGKGYKLGQKETDKGAVGEELVQEIAYKSFLRYWCFPNPIDIKGNKKEICDLLVLFNDVCIIVSVKNYSYTGNYDTFIKKTINKSINQLNGAERKLFSKTNRIYIKHPDRNEILFTPCQYNKIHKIIINVGDSIEFYPMGKYSKNNWITIFCKEVLDTAFQELDTIKDFIKYLDDRHLFLTSIKSIDIIGTEADLCAYYLKNKRVFPILNEIEKEQFDHAMIELEGTWDEYNQHQDVLWKRNRNQSSYLIDELVQRELLKHPHAEKISETLISLSRLERRGIANSIIEFYKKYKNRRDNVFARRISYNSDPCIIIVFYGKEFNQLELEAALRLTIEHTAIKTKYNTSKYIVIGFTYEFSGFVFGYNEIKNPLTIEEEKEIMELASNLGWGKNIVKTHQKETEYPQ